MRGDRVAVVIEDDADIRRLLEQVLEQAGFETHSAGNGLDGIEEVRRHHPTLTTLDISMPGIDGFETAKRIRAFSETYLIMLTARSDEIDTLMGLEAGADDYVAKPFRPRELRARIEAMLRRPRLEEPQAVPATRPVESDAGWLEHRGLRLHSEMHLVTIDGDELELTRSEFELLHDLMSSRRRVRSKSDLAVALRGEGYVTSSYVSDADRRAVEVHLANLRRKIGESASHPRWIETVRGVGYRLTADDA
ncbi:response regulator transcription factor [Agromyces albus]|uniref:Response regulator transcription factor n=1 Tax=Agromyces albus TaxID=205332 RepID=A0A4Q2L3W8_9MICO|nr:response regulator transcription factor [Agromyces albus]RXZ72259.1 response regulator transcription factor [Agromyces albus]